MQPSRHPRPTAPSLATRLKQWQLRELFADKGEPRPGISTEIDATPPGAGLSLLARHAAGAVLLHLSPLGESIPAHLERRAIRSAAGAGAADILIFTDVLRTSQVWQWAERRGNLQLPRECRYVPNGKGTDLRRILGLLEGSGRQPAPPRESPGHPEVERAVVQALLRRAMRNAADPVRRELAAVTELAMQPLLDAVVASRNPATVRALLRILDGTPAQPAFAVIDTAAVEPDALQAAGEALAMLREAALERAAIFLADAATLGGNARPRSLADFAATLEEADDPSRFCSRGEFAIFQTLRHNLFATPATAGAGAALATAVARRLGAERCPPELRFHIRPGDGRGGVRDLTAAGLGVLDAEATEVHRLAALGVGAVGDTAAVFTELGRRLGAINFKVIHRRGNPSAAAAQGHWGCDFRPVMQGGGFDLILPEVSAGE